MNATTMHEQTTGERPALVFVSEGDLGLMQMRQGLKVLYWSVFTPRGNKRRKPRPVPVEDWRTLERLARQVLAEAHITLEIGQVLADCPPGFADLVRSARASKSEQQAQQKGDE
jgi:hypothetical protein